MKTETEIYEMFQESLNAYRSCDDEEDFIDTVRETLAWVLDLKNSKPPL